MGERDSGNSLATHGFQHIGQVIRHKYPESDGANEPVERRLFDIAIVLATTIVLVATPAAIFLLVNDKPLYGLAALVTALGAAFGPKIYADFIQPKAPSAGIQNP